MVMNVFDLAQEDTRLSKVSHKEYAGPCPGCKSTDSFHVQPDRKDGGAWMCRRCWPAESKGWGDGIEYLRQFRSMSFQAAKAYLYGEVDTAIERVARVERHIERQQSELKPGQAPGEQWQAYAASYAAQAEQRLWIPEGRAALDYLLARGLKPETIHAAHMGYIEKNGIPYVVIPWYADGVYWCINHRDMRPDVPQKQRYKALYGSAKGAALYMGDSIIKYDRPVFVVEGEIDALILAQEAGELISVVATGGHDCSQGMKWIGRLARASVLFIAYDRDARGEQKAKRWLEVFINSRRWHPMVMKDVSAMLAKGFDIKQWVEIGLEVWHEETDPDPAQEQDAASDQDGGEPWVCSACGVDLSASDQDAYYDENGSPFCEKHGPLASVQIPALTKEQFLAHVEQLASALTESTGENWRVTPVEPGYTLEKHVARQEQERKAQEQQQQRTARQRQRKQIKKS